MGRGEVGGSRGVVRVEAGEGGGGVQYLFKEIDRLSLEEVNRGPRNH